MATLSSQLAFLNGRRKTYIGQTDKYAVRNAGATGDLRDMMAGLGFMAVTGSHEFFSEAYRESAQQRFEKYKISFNFYNGDHWANPWDDGERKPTFNFCAPIIDVTTDFFLANGFEIRCVEGNEKLAEAYNLIWAANDKEEFTRRLAKCAFTFGDAYIYVTVQTKDDAGKELPKDQYKIRFTVLPPYFVFPLWEDLECTKMKACLIQYPIKTESGSAGIYSVLITKEEYRVYVNGQQQGPKQPNPFGEVNVVHYRNEADAGMAFGKSDLEQIIPLNEEYNSVSHSIRRIIRYHAEPVTVIYGAKASRLEKGADKIWSGLPSDAKVENLTFQSDLGACNTYLTTVEDKIYAISQCPKQVLFPPQNISNVSAAALQTLFMPLINKVNRKRKGFVRVVTDICRLTRVIHTKMMGEALEQELADYPEKADLVSVRFTSILPNDETALIDAAIKRINAGLSSKATEMRKLHQEWGDTERIALEIVADTIEKLAFKREEAVALKGGVPDATAAFTGSIAMCEDFTKLAENMKVIAEDMENEENAEA